MANLLFSNPCRVIYTVNRPSLSETTISMVQPNKCKILVYLWWHLREVSFFELARLVVDVDDGGDQGEGGQQKEEDGLDTKAGRGAARLVGLGLPRLGPVELYREHKECFIGANYFYLSLLSSTPRL